MRLTYAVLGLVCCSLAVVGCTSSPNSGTIQGRVFFEGLDLHAGVIISISGPASDQVASGNDGTFAFNDVPPGTYVVTATAAHTRELVQPARIQVTGPEPVIVPEFRFSPLGEITGTIITDGAAGRAGTLIVVEGTSSATLTSEDGSFTLTGVPSGPRSLVFSRQGFRSERLTQLVVPHAAAVDVGELVLQPASPEGVVRGRAHLVGEADHSGIALTLTGPTPGAAVTNAEGDFTFFGVSAGTYSVFASVEDSLGGLQVQTIEVQDGSDVALPSAFEFVVVGNIEGLATTGPAGTNAGILITAQNTGILTYTNADGTYSLRGVPTGSHTVIASTPGYSSSTAVVLVSRGTTASASDLALTPAVHAGEITGKALYLGEANHAGISLTLSGPVHAVGTTIVDGSFTFPGLPDGSYIVTASAPSALEGLQIRSVAIVQGSAASLSPGFEFTPAGKIEGVASLSGIGPSAGIQLYVPGTTATAITDANGQYTLENVPVGTHSIVAAMAGYQTAIIPGTAVAKKTTATAPNVTLVPVLHLIAVTGTVSPPAGRDNAWVSISFTANEPVDHCAASVAGLVATCSPPVGTTCQCQWMVPSSVPGGTVQVTMSAEKNGILGSALGEFVIDRNPPLVRAEKLQILRRPLGTNDGLIAQALAFEEAAPAYVGQEVALVRVWNETGVLLTTAVPNSDGSLSILEFPLTDGLSPSNYAPARVFVSAEDSVGNESVQVEVLAGTASMGAALDPAPIFIMRRDLTAADGVHGAAGAVIDGVCAPREVYLTDFDTGQPVGAGPVGSNGSFAEIALGTATESRARVLVSVIDKCAVISSAVEPGAGTVTSPPTVDGLELEFLERTGTASDAVVGRAGSVVAPGTVVREVRIQDSDGSSLAAPIVPASDGSFPAHSIGATGFDRAYVVAVSKVGLASAPIQTRLLSSVLTLAGRVPYVDSSARAALYAAIHPFDPRTGGPGEVLALGREVSASEYPAVASADGVTVTTTAPALAHLSEWGLHSAIRRYAASFAFDTQRSRLVVTTGDATGDPFRRVGATETMEVISGRWTRIETLLEPPRRYHGAMVYDAARARVVLFGGGFTGSPYIRNDTWEYDGSTWTEVVTPVKPPARMMHSLAYDPVRQRVVLFGGNGSGTLGDTWEYDGSSWVQVLPAASPGARRGAAMAYDANRQRILLFGGATSSGSELADTWEYDGASWTKLAPATAPSPRRGGAMAFDSSRMKMVLFGGGVSAWTALSDTWEFDGTTWTSVVPPHRPEPRTFHTLVFDPASQRVLVVGGGSDIISADVEPTYDTTTFWAFDGLDWIQPNQQGFPAALNNILWDPRLQRLTGFEATQPVITWEHDGASWEQVTTGFPPPQELRPHIATIDPISGTHYVLPYSGSLPPYQNREWLYPGSGFPCVPQLAFDSARGLIAAYCESGTTAGELWFSDGQPFSPAWKAPTTGSPPPRTGGVFVYDAARDVLHLSGGLQAVQAADTWEYDGTGWVQRVTASTPNPGRTSGGYDVGRRRVLSFGNGARTTGEFWEYTGTDWVKSLLPPGWNELHILSATYSSRAEGVLLGIGSFNSIRQLHSYRERPGGSAAAVHQALFSLDPSSQLNGAQLKFIGTAASDQAGVEGPGVELLAWNWVSRSWVSLGTHSALPTAPEGDRTLLANLPNPQEFLQRGRTWILATSTGRSSAPGGSISSRVHTDYIELSATVILPAN